MLVRLALESAKRGRGPGHDRSEALVGLGDLGVEMLHALTDSTERTPECYSQPCQVPTATITVPMAQNTGTNATSAQSFQRRPRPPLLMRRLPIPALNAGAGRHPKPP
jgi:hypothetical protein